MASQGLHASLSKVWKGARENFPNFGKSPHRAYPSEMARSKSQYPELYQRFGQLLAEERKKRNLTQSEVAQRLSKPPSAVWKYENSELRLDVIEFIALAEAIGFDPEELISRLRKK